MAVLATNQITVSWVTDVESVTWYYLLQASTAQPPAKPTTDPPTGWTTTEPGYTSGSTNSLYICQKTVFSDGTFEYSDVSLSSSYEAAKEAYNRAVAAQTAANNANAEEQTVYIQAVSGTNTLPSETIALLSSWISYSGESTTSDTSGLTPVWTIKRPTYRGNYPVLFVATQRKTVSGTITYTTPLKDDTVTIIDGGHITTGTIDASAVNVTNLDASEITTGTLNASRISTIAESQVSGLTTDLANAEKVATNYVTEITGNTGITVHTNNTTNYPGYVQITDSIKVSDGAVSESYVNIGSSGVNIYDDAVKVSSFTDTGIQLGQDNDARLEVDSNGIEMFDENGDSSAEFNSDSIRLGDENGTHTVLDSNGMSILAPGNTLITETFPFNAPNPTFIVSHQIIELRHVIEYIEGVGSSDFVATASFDGNTVTMGSYIAGGSTVEITYIYNGEAVVGSFLTSGVQIGNNAGAYISVDGNSEKFYDETGKEIAAINSNISGLDIIPSEQVDSIIFGESYIPSSHAPRTKNYTLKGLPESPTDIRIRYEFKYPGQDKQYSEVHFTAGVADTLYLTGLLGVQTINITYDGAKDFTIVYTGWNDTPTVEVSGVARYTTLSSISTYEFGDNVEASSSYAFAVGSKTQAEGVYSFAEGMYTFAAGDFSHAMGENTSATGSASLAIGSYTDAMGANSFSAGSGTIAIADNQFVIGQYNSEMPNSIFVIGDGTGTLDRSNVVSIDHGGYIHRRGPNMGCDLYLTDVSSQIGQAPSSDKYTPFVLKDKNGSNTCYIQNVIYANGNLRTDYITTRLDASGTRLYNGFYQHIYADGTYGITFTNAATKAAWLNGLGAAEATANMGNPTLNTGTVAQNTSCKTDRQVSINLRLTGCTFSASGTQTLGTIPSGFRPSAEAFCIVLEDGVYRNARITTAGVITIYSGAVISSKEIKVMSTYRTS